MTHSSYEHFILKKNHFFQESWLASSGGNTSADLSAADLNHLQKWINPAYLKPESWTKIAAKMDDDGSVQLQRFLCKHISDQISAAAASQDNKEGVGGGRIPDFTTGCGQGTSLLYRHCTIVICSSY